jgi:hypothetical protein
LTSGGDDYGRIADAIGKQEGYGRAGTIATDQNNPGDLKWGPFAQAHGATGPGRGGHAIFPDAATGRSAMIDLLKSPKYAGKSIAEIGRTYAEDPKWGAGVAKAAGLPPSYIPGSGKPGVPPHFGLADIRKSVEGTAGDGKYTGVGGYNFMGSARARAMGMGDVTHGGPLAHMRWPTGIPKGEGPASILANKYAGSDMAGFLKDLHDAGAPLKQFAGAYVNKPLQHGYGNALDIETGFGSGPDNSPALYAWAQKHPKEFAEIQATHHMRNLDTSSGAGMHDWGHFEWTPTGRALGKAGVPPATKDALAKTRPMPNIGAAIGGTAIDNSRFRLNKSSLEALRAGKQDDLDSVRSGGSGGRFGGMTFDKLRNRDPIGDAERNLKFGPKSKPDDDYSLHPKEQKANYDLLGHAREAGMIGAPMKHEVSGNASLDINLNGFPKGTATKAKMSGMFAELKVKRGRAAPLAHQDG